MWWSVKTENKKKRETYFIALLKILAKIAKKKKLRQIALDGLEHDVVYRSAGNVEYVVEANAQIVDGMRNMNDQVDEAIMIDDLVTWKVPHPGRNYQFA